MKSRSLPILSFVSCCALLSGCQENPSMAEVVTQTNGSLQAYPDIDRPLEDIPRSIVNDANGAGQNTAWQCYEPLTGDVVISTEVIFNTDGSGTYHDRALVPMTWSLYGDDLVMQVAEETVTYHDVSLPISTTLQATILGPDEVSPDDVGPVAPVVSGVTAASDGTGGFRCLLSYKNDVETVLVPLTPEMFANGATPDAMNSFWSCYPRVEMALSLDGLGSLTIGEQGNLAIARREASVSNWQITDGALTITADDGTMAEFSVRLHRGATLAGSFSQDGVSYGRQDCSLQR